MTTTSYARRAPRAPEIPGRRVGRVRVHGAFASILLIFALLAGMTPSWASAAVARDLPAGESVALFARVVSADNGRLIVMPFEPVVGIGQWQIVSSRSLPESLPAGEPVTVAVSPGAVVEVSGALADLPAGTPILVGGYLNGATLDAHVVADLRLARAHTLTPAEEYRLAQDGVWTPGSDEGAQLVAPLLARAPTQTGYEVLEFRGQFGGPSLEFSDMPNIVLLDIGIVRVTFKGYSFVASLAGGSFDFPFEFDVSGAVPVVGEASPFTLALTPRSPANAVKTFQFGLGVDFDLFFHVYTPVGCGNFWLEPCDFDSTIDVVTLGWMNSTVAPPPLPGQSLPVPTTSCPSVGFKVDDDIGISLGVCNFFTIGGAPFSADLTAVGGTLAATPTRLSWTGPPLQASVTPTGGPLMLQLTNFEYRPRLDYQLFARLDLLGLRWDSPPASIFVTDFPAVPPGYTGNILLGYVTAPGGQPELAEFTFDTGGIEVQMRQPPALPPGAAADVPIRVTNRGTTPLSAVTVRDPICGEQFVGSLAPGASFEYGCVFSVPADMLYSATASGVLAGGATVTANASMLIALQDGLVGSGTPETCTEFALRAELDAGGAIGFSCGVAPHTITLRNSQLIVRDATLDGANLVTISGANRVRVFDIRAGVALTLRHLTITDGNDSEAVDPGGGGAIRNFGILTVEDCVFMRNGAALAGGAVRNFGVATFSGSLFRDNYAGSGGAIHNRRWTPPGGSLSSGELTIATTQFIDNAAVAGDGGAIGNTDGGYVTVTAGYFSGNSATGGGALLNYVAGMVISDSEFVANAASNGGALENAGGGMMWISGGRIVGNTAANIGGGIANLDAMSELRVTNVLIGEEGAGNTAINGGGIANNGKLVMIAGSALRANYASLAGGALRNFTGVTTIADSLLIGNASSYGGAIHNAGLLGIQVSENGSPVAGSSVLAGNVAQVDGGALYNDGNARILNSTIGGVTPGDANRARGGGGIINWGGNLDVFQSAIIGNQAQNGGGIENGGNAADGRIGNLTVENVTIANNSADYRGGGFVSFGDAEATLALTTIAGNVSPEGSALTVDDKGGSIVRLAQNIIVAGPAAIACQGPLLSEGYNVVSDGTCGLSAAGDVLNVAVGLAPLADNGGATLTQALAAASPAIDRIPFAACRDMFDQRGMSRPVGAGCDSGAYEAPFTIAPVYPQAAGNTTVLLDPLNDATLGTLHGAAAYQLSRPYLNQALQLGAGTFVRYDLTPWYLSIGPGTGAAAETQGSIELWMKPAVYGRILTLNWYAANVMPPAGHVLHLALDPASGVVNYSVWNDEYAVQQLNGVTPIPLEEWTHVAVTWSRGGTRLYINGQLDASSRVNIYPAIGYYGMPEIYAYLNGWGVDGANGLVDELHIVSRALAADVIAYHAGGVIDTFNRKNGPLDRSWVGPEGLGGYQIIGQQVDVVGGGPIFWKSDRFAAAQEVEVTFTAVDSLGREQALLLKVQNPPDWRKGLIAVCYDAQTGTARVETLRRGMTVWTIYPAATLVLQSGDQFGAQARADGRVLVFHNRALVGVVTLNDADQAFFNTKGGMLGLWFIDAEGAALDDFRGGSIIP